MKRSVLFFMMIFSVTTFSTFDPEALVEQPPSVMKRCWLRELCCKKKVECNCGQVFLAGTLLTAVGGLLTWMAIAISQAHSDTP